MAVTWSYENAAHLLRRAAFGGTPVEIQAFLNRHATVGEAVDELLSFGVLNKKPPGPRSVDDLQRLKMQRWWLKTILRTLTPADACREKLTLYWHGHLVSGSSKQPTLKYMSLQNQLFRVNARGNFKSLVRAFNRDAANLYYLDGIDNVASNDGVHVNANENFGRELMELFTLGVFQLAPDGSPDPTRPNYTEDDVHNLARACTGWTSLARNKGAWNEDDWDGGRYDDDGDGLPDPVVIFGVQNSNFRIDDAVAGTSDDVLDLIFARQDADGNNQVAMFVARKLWSYFAYPPPAPGLKDLLAGFAATFVANDFEVTPLLRAMWTDDEFYGSLARSRTVKTPVDYAVGAMRALGVVRSDGKYVGGADAELGDSIRAMGMNLFEPPNVAGWPGGLSWINSGTLLSRLEFAKNLAAADFGRNKVLLSGIVGLPIGNAAANPGVVVDAILHQLGLDTPPRALSSAQRQALIDYATTGGPTLNLSDEFTNDATVKVRGLIALALQSAEAQIF
jgi:uncharacterized protein (DUF1800 family)